MSRPPIDEKDKRIVQVNIRLTVEESSIVNEQAEASGISPANWIRHKIFTGKFPPVRMSLIDAALYQELKRIGVNVNQATHKLNAGEHPAHYLLAQVQLEKMLDKLFKVITHDREHD
ncbi:MAG: hypothetical protein DI538_25830 [Azospira oryzae]|jgi:hypothetical protein|nr:MAG: hypothetical protein DI538_25830 [Azospira oryzae]